MFSFMIFYSLISLSYAINNNNNEWVRVTKNSLIEVRVTGHEFSTTNHLANNNKNACQEDQSKSDDANDVLLFVELEYEEMKKNETSSFSTVRHTLEKEVKFDSCQQILPKDKSHYYEKNANIAFFLPVETNDIDNNSQYGTTSGGRVETDQYGFQKKKEQNIIKTSIKASLVQKDNDWKTKLHYEESSRADTITMPPPPSRTISTVMRDSDGKTIQVDPLHLHMEWTTRKETNYKNNSRRTYLHYDMIRFYIELVVLFIAIGFQRNSLGQSLGLKKIDWRKYWEETYKYIKRISSWLSNYLHFHDRPNGYYYHYCYYYCYYYFYHPLSKMYHYLKEFYLRNNINMTMISCPPEIIRLSYPKLFFDNSGENFDYKLGEENDEILTDETLRTQHVQRNQLKDNNNDTDGNLVLTSTTVTKSGMEVTKDIMDIVTPNDENSQRGVPQERLFLLHNNNNNNNNNEGEPSVQGHHEQSHHSFNLQNDIEEKHSKTNDGPDTYVTEDTKGKKESDSSNIESITESSHSSLFVRMKSHKNQRLIVSSQDNDEEDTVVIEPPLLRTNPSVSQVQTKSRLLDPELPKTENETNENNERSPMIDLKPSDALLSISYDLMKPVWEFGQTSLQQKDKGKRDKDQDVVIRKQGRYSTIPTSIVIPSTHSIPSFSRSRKRKSLKENHTMVKLRRSKRKRGPS